MIRPTINSLLNTKMFKVELPKIKKQKISHDDNTYLWHLRLGHINLHRINRLVKDGSLRDLNVGTLPVCESYLDGKMIKRLFSTKGSSAQEPLRLIHSDICDPMTTQARGDYEYFVTFVDDYSRYGYISLTQHKFETFGNFKEFKSESKN